MVNLQIGLFGGSSTTDTELLSIAEEVGRLIAKKNATLFCGNVKGVLGAALKGAKSEKGKTVVVAPYDHHNVNLSNVDVYIASSLNWFSRGPALVNSLDGIVVVGGGVGTLTELAYGWWQEIPIVIIETGEMSDQYIGRTFDKRKEHKVLGAKNPQEAIHKLFEAVSNSSGKQN